MLVLCFVTTNIILDIRKRDELYMPLKKNQNGYPAEKLLVEAVEIFKAWKSSGSIGLTSETFTACIHTIGAILKLACYLIDDGSIEYVLTGKLMSDPLEGRFGWYRQANGGNFYKSVKQILAEKKIVVVITPPLPRSRGTARTAIQVHAVNLIDIRLGEKWQLILNQS